MELELNAELNFKVPVKMPSNCAVATCNFRGGQYSDDGSKLSFFCFPKDPERRATWVHKCARDDKFDASMTRVCSRHFAESDYEQSYLVKRTLVPNVTPVLKRSAVPSLNLPTSHTK